MNPDFTTSTLSFSTLASGAFDVITESGVTIGSVTNNAVTTTSPTTHVFTYVTVTTYYSDVYFLTSTQTYTFTHGTTSQVIPDLSCSLAGTTSISYSIADYNGVTYPSWVTINSSTGQLTIIAPGTITTSSYSFYVSSAITGATNSVDKIITINLIN